MTRASAVFLLCFVVAAPVPILAQSPDPNGPAEVRALAESEYEGVRLLKVANAVRITGDITLDGRLDEPEWMLATPATDFIQRAPQTGELLSPGVRCPRPARCPSR